MITFKKRPVARKGFTLVELLIVIIIIGILAGMMMLTTGAATDKTEAIKIVSNLRSLKAAALMYYVDHKAWPGAGDWTSDSAMVASLERYIDRSIDLASYGKLVIRSRDNGRMYIGFNGGPKMLDLGISEKLAQIANDSGVYDADGNAYTKGKYSAVVNMK